MTALFLLAVVKIAISQMQMMALITVAMFVCCGTAASRERERVVAWRAICRLVAILAAAAGRQRAIFLPTPQHTRKLTLS